MFKILLALLLMTSQAFATTAWRNGTGENSLLGTSNASDIDTGTYNNIVKPLDNLLATFCNQYMTYTSAGTLTVSSGSVMVSNSDGSVRLTLINTSTTAVDFTNIDTGAEAPSTTYYVYAVAAATSSTAATYKISANSTSPSGSTYYYKLGSFFNDATSNISGIANTVWHAYVGSPSSKSSSVVYQALTDGIVTDLYAFTTNSSAKSITDYSDSNSSPSTIVGGADDTNSSSGRGTITFAVRKGDYYEVTDNGSCNHTITFKPTGI